MGDFYKNRNGETTNPVKDYRERFEFKFTVGNNIICQRYFKISGFNEKCLSSVELSDAMEYCAKLIDKDLKDKTAIYLDMMAPKIFENADEMKKYFENPYNRAEMHLGEGIVLKKPVGGPNYFWGKNDAPVVATEKFDNGSEFVTELTDEDWVEYKLTFYDNGPQFYNTPEAREVCSVVWIGCYPKGVRLSIDLSNKKGRMKPEDVTGLKYEAYVGYKMSQGKQDIVYNIINNIVNVCSFAPDEQYTHKMAYGNTVYDNYKYAEDCKRGIRSLNAKAIR